MAQNIVFKVSADTTGIKTGLEQASDATKKAKKEVASLDEQFVKLGNVIGVTFAVTSLIAFTKELTKINGEFESLQKRLASIKGSEDAGARTFQNLAQMANELGLNMQDLTNNFVQFVSAAKASGMQVTTAEKIFKNMSIAIAGSGASAESASRAMTALTQMIGKGKISAEELRGQLGEAMPVSMGIMAKSLGVTTQELDKMMASGQLMASEVLPKFAREMAKAFGKDAQEMAKGLTAEVNRLENAWTAFKLSLGDTAPLLGVSKILTTLLERTTKGIDVINKGFTAVYMGDVQKEKTKQAQVVLSKVIADFDAKKLSDEERIAKLQVIQNKGLEEERKTYLQIQVISAKLNQGTQAENVEKKKAVFALTEKLERQKAYNAVFGEELKGLKELTSGQKESVQLTEAQIKALEKERKEREKIRLEVEAGQKLIRAWMIDREARTKELMVGPEVPDYAKGLGIGSEQMAEDRAKRGVAELETDRLMRQTFFDLELEDLNIQNEMKLMSEEEYLKKVLELRKKYGLDVKDVEKQLTDDDIKIKQDQKAMAVDLAGQTASGIASVVVNQKQKEIRSQQELVEEQRQKGLISEEQYQSQVRAIKRKQMMMDKIAAISQITINTAIALTNPTNIASFGAISPFIIASGAVSAGLVLAQPVPYNKGTKRVPMMRGAIRGKDSVHAILTPDERVVPADINTQPGYSALLDLAQDRKISDKEAGFIAEMAMGGRASSNQPALDPDVIGKAIAKYIPHTSVKINERGIAVITEQSRSEIRRLKSRIG
jgi:tape measure domain-containing protein